jgi:hypothetical protein
MGALFSLPLTLEKIFWGTGPGSPSRPAKPPVGLGLDGVARSGRWLAG